MKKHYEPECRETWYEETLNNGLYVVVFEKPDFVTTSCVLAVPYGSLDCKQTDEEGNTYSFPMGSAHFLEHKLFESDEGDAMNDFARLGANVNAFTSYDETCYYFDTPADPKVPLGMLLDFVQDLSITDSSVEKEKGIILQERHMYLQDAESRILLETMRSLFRNYPINEDITGSDESIMAMRKKELEECYAMNYHPGRMTLVCVTPLSAERIFSLVEENQAHKTFPAPKNLKRYAWEEGNKPIRDTFSLKMDVSVPRIMYGIRMPVIDKDNTARMKREWSLRMRLDSWFTSVNPQYQSWIDEGRISPYFSFEEDFYEDAQILVFADEALDPQSFRSFLEEQLKACMNTAMQEDTLDQLKKRTMGSYLHIFDDPARLSLTMCESLMDDVSLFEEYRIVSSLTPDMIQQQVKELDFSCSTLTVLNPLE